MNLVNYKTEKGFILIDSIIATLVLGITLLFIGGLINTAIRTYSTNDERMRAFQIGSGYADALQSLSVADWNAQVTSTTYTNIDLSSGIFNTCLTNANNNRARLPGSIVTVQARQSSGSAVGNRLAEVRITTTWNHGTTSNNVVIVKYYVRNLTASP